MRYAGQTYTPKRAGRRQRRRPLIADILLLSIMAGLSTLAVSAGAHALMAWNAKRISPEKNSPAEKITASEVEFTDDDVLSVETTRLQAAETPPTVPNEPGPALPETYDFSKPVPLSNPVDTTYFDDAVFIGDSRTEGLFLNTSLSNTTFFAHMGLMVDTVFTRPLFNVDGEKVPVMDALKATDFSKVYIMLGINETGWAYSSIFVQKYGDIVDAIREINPNALIYIQAIMPVSQEVSNTHSYVKNPKINEYNQLLQQLAEEKQVYYIDTANAVAGEDGSLPDDAAPDGIHLVRSYCQRWLDYLITHTIVL